MVFHDDFFGVFGYLRTGITIEGSYHKLHAHYIVEPITVFSLVALTMKK